MLEFHFSGTAQWDLLCWLGCRCMVPPLGSQLRVTVILSIPGGGLRLQERPLFTVQTNIFESFLDK